MKLFEAEKLAVNLMNKYGLIEKGWIFKFSRAVRTNGLCHQKEKYISLSSVKVSLNEEPVIKNTILHEIAHALVGVEHGHDWVWKQKAIEIGCTGERLSKGYILPEAKYKGVCPNGHISRAHKKKKTITSCGRCSKVFDERFIITYTLNEKHETFSN